MRILMFLTLTAILSGVGCKVESKSSSKKAAYSYDFNILGCRAAQSAPTLEGICKKLEDHALNNNCAMNERAMEYSRYDCFTVLGSKPSATAVVMENQVEQYTYTLSEETCTTGPQYFSSKRDMCAGLENHELNQRCALTLRQEMFAAQGCE